VELSNLKGILEALLFVADRPLELHQLERITGLEPSRIEEALAALAQEYRQRGLRLQRLGDAFQLVTAAEAAPFVERLLGVEGGGRLSQAALESLAIIAYKQPITRAGVEAIRGVNSDRAIATLLARGLVAEVGRLDTAGRPALLATTFDFLQHLGLERLEDLPPLPTDVAS